MEDIINIDYSIFRLLNSIAGKNVFLDAVIAVFAVYLVYAVVVILVFYWFVNKDKLAARAAVVHAFFSFVLAKLIITEAIRLVWHRPRPFETCGVVELFNKGSEPSFPSGHASAMFAISMSVYLYNKKLGGMLFAGAAIISISRVISGVHYPFDIAAGVVIGIFAPLILRKVLGKRIKSAAAAVSNFSDRVFAKLPFTTKG